MYRLKAAVMRQQCDRYDTVPKSASDRSYPPRPLVFARVFCRIQVVRFVPPLVATAADISTALSIIDQALAKVTSGAK